MKRCSALVSFNTNAFTSNGTDLNVQYFKICGKPFLIPEIALPKSADLLNYEYVTQQVFEAKLHKIFKTLCF